MHNSRLKRAGLKLAAFAVAALVALTVYAGSFNRTCSVTGGSAQQLSSVLSTCGYTGANQLQELIIVNPSTATNTLYVGQSDDSAVNGLPLLPGESITYRAASQQDAIPATGIYLFVSSTQNAGFSARSK